jgi:outer membrane protein assembly complex protein YaeT
MLDKLRFACGSIGGQSQLADRSRFAGSMWPAASILLACWMIMGWSRVGYAQEERSGEQVLDVRIIGNSTVATDRILSAITTKPGRPYFEDTVKNDIAQLYAKRWFYDIKTDIDRKPEGVIVIFKVSERPVIQEVIFQGAETRPFNEKKLKELTDLRAGKSMDPEINRSAARQLERAYHEKGYPFATVQLVEGGNYGDKKVVMRITQGPKTRITDIEFEGQQFVSGSRLKTFLEHKEAWGSRLNLPVFGGTWPGGDGIEADRVKLIEYYRSFGFLDVKIGRRIDYTEDRSRVRLTYIIDEGRQYKVRDVKLVGNKVFDEQKLTNDLQLTSGEVLQRGKLEQDVSKIRETYGKEGYVFAAVNVEQRVTDKPGEVDLYYQVTEDLPRKIGRINIEGNEITKGRVINNVMQLEPGQIADTTELRRAQARLSGSRLFEVNPQQGIQPVVEFDPANDPSSEFQDIRVRVQEAQTGQLMLGAGVNSDSGVGGSLVIHERNFDLFAIPTSWNDIREGRVFRGAGQELRIEAIPGNLVHRYSVTFREPSLFGTTYSFTSSGYYYRRIFQSWREERLGGRFSLGKQFTRTLGGSLTLRAENVNIDSPREPSPQDLIDVLGNNALFSGRIGVSHDTRDSNLRPSEGHYVELAFEQAFGDFTFPKGTLEGRQYWTVTSRADGSGKHIVAARGELGLTGGDTPIFERFYAGGFRTLRGYQFRGVSPVDLGIEVGGDFMMLTGLEYQFPITADDNIGGAFFIDAGTVERDFEIKDYRVAAGFGLRLAIPGMGPVPLAFDFAFPIVSNPNDDEQIFSFSVGWFN